MNKLPWIATAVLTATAGLLVAQVTHKNVPVSIDTMAQPGKVRVEYAQTAPALGKILSIVFAGATAGSLWMAFRDESEAEPTVTASLRPRTTVKAQSPARATIRYDDDAEIDVEDLVEDEIKDESPEPIPQNDVFFKNLFYHLRRHVIMPCATGSGKTTVLLGAVKWAVNHFGYDGVEFFVSTTKKGNFLGLDKLKAGDGRSHVLFIDPENPDTILPLYERLRWLRKRLIARGEQRMKAEEQGKECRPKRNVIILDEWNECLDVAQSYDQVYNRSLEKGEEKSYLHDEMKRCLNSFIRTGREDEIVVWVFGQDHQVQNCGINTGYTKSIGVVIPFRADGGMDSIEDAFVGQRPLVKGVGKELLAKARELVEQHPDKSFAYSNLYGHQFLEVPYLPTIKREKIFDTPSNVVSLRAKVEPQRVVNGADVDDDPWD